MNRKVSNSLLGLLIAGALALLVGAMLPWVSWVGLWGEAARGAERLAIGWEGDGFATATCGLALLAAAGFARSKPHPFVTAAILVVAVVPLLIVVGDLHRIAAIGPSGGIVGTVREGLYLTALGGFLGVAGGVLASPAARPSRQPRNRS